MKKKIMTSCLHLLISGLLLILFSNCGRIYNNNSQDASNYSPRPTGSAFFNSATTILVNKCSECHGNWNSYSEANFIAAGLITAQNISASPIYYRNQLAPGPNNNMPAAGRPALTTDELQILADWINSL